MSGFTTGTSFTRKAIDLTITLGTGNDGLAVGAAVTLTGLRTTATITNQASPDIGQAHVKVYGVTFDIMSGLTNVLDPYYSARNNQITIKAGDEGNTVVVFQGVITDAFMNFEGMPETCMEISAYSSIRVYLQKPLAEKSWDGETDVATMIQDVLNAAAAPWTLDNQLKVPIKLKNHHESGSMWTQINSICAAANIWVKFEDKTQVVSIWNKDQALPGVVTPVVSPANGMVGYPMKVDGSQIRIKTLFNNQITYGGQVLVEGSQIAIANGTWTLYQVQHELAAYIPGGPWFTTFTGWAPKFGGLTPANGLPAPPGGG